MSSAHPAEVLAIDAFGVPVQVACAPELSERFRTELAAAWSRTQPTGMPAPEVRITAGLGGPDERRHSASASAPEVCVTAETEGALAEQLAGAITRAAIGARVGGPLMLHAAALEIAPGEVHGFVAASGTGKTTLARTLGRSCGYVTDETLVVDTDDLTVTAYPKPLCILPPGAVPGETKDVCGPDALGLQPLSGHRLHLQALHLLVRGSDVAAARGPIEPIEALMQIGAQSSALDAFPRPLYVLHRVITACAQVDVLRYSEAADLLGVLTE